MNLCALHSGRLHPPRLLRAVAGRERNHRRRVHRPRPRRLPPKGVTHITEIMTDNHWSYTRSRAFASLLAQHGIRHITIKPYHPQQNGKVERYNQTLKPKWANSQPRPNNQTRNQALRHWLQRVQRRFSRLAAFMPHHPSLGLVLSGSLVG